MSALPDSADPPSRTSRALALSIFLVLVVFVIAYAWVSDDAFITLRTVDHFVEGRGLVWNPGDRVQAYTHPLWMLLLSAGYFVTREAYYTTLTIGLLFSILTLILLQRSFFPHPRAAAILFLILALSRSFIDYSTSGLENPLTHLLMVAFYGLLLAGGSLASLSLLAALTVLSRLDAGLLLLPGLIVAVLRGFRSQGRSFCRKLLAAVLVAGAPFWIWELFSLVYYGSLIPNTALAKLGHGYPRDEVFVRGVNYLLDALEHDPLTSVIVLAGLGLPFFSRRLDHVAIAAGVLLYLAYLMWIGGDFMRGRLLTAPLLAALVLLSGLPYSSRKVVWGLGLLALVLGLAGYHPTPFLHLDPTADPEAERHWGTAALTEWGIADERGYYAKQTGLLAVGLGGDGPDHEWRRIGEALGAQPDPGDQRAVHVATSVGLLGFYAPAEVTIIDTFALADPLLSRLPARREVRWRIGHFQRVVPTGYAETIRSGRNRFEDAALGRLWRQIETVIRAPIFDRERLVAIWRLNTGIARRLIDRERYRYAGARQVPLARVVRSPPTRRIAFGDTGLLLTVRRWLRNPALELALSAGAYEVIVYCDGQRAVRQRLDSQARPRQREEARVPVAPVDIDLSSLVDRSCIDRIRILPLVDPGPRYLAGGRPLQPSLSPDPVQ